MPTVVTSGSSIAIKWYSVALFNETIRRGTFRRNLTGPAPKQSSAEMKAKGQTSSAMPFVTITDLQSGPGDTVTVDLFNIISGKPTMGDRRLAGRMMSLSSSSMEMKVNQCRGGVDTGGRMTRKRTRHNLRSIAKANLAGWNARLYDQLSMVHCAGARGTQNDAEWVVPLTTDSEYTEIVVNTVLPPTRNRRFFAGDATSVTNLDTADILTLNDLDRIRMTLGEMPFTMQPVQLEGDPQAEEDPLYVLYVSERVWYNIQISTTGQNWRTFLAAAHERSRDFKHPLFMGNPGYWAGFLVKKMKRAIRYAAAETVSEYNASDVAADVTAAVGFDRCLLLGGQALAIAFGNMEGAGGDGYHFEWHEELSDHGAVKEISSAACSGVAKVRFTGSDGAPTDHGVATIDCYAPTT